MPLCIVLMHFQFFSISFRKHAMELPMKIFENYEPDKYGQHPEDPTRSFNGGPRNNSPKRLRQVEKNGEDYPFLHIITQNLLPNSGNTILH